MTKRTLELVQLVSRTMNDFLSHKYRGSGTPVNGDHWGDWYYSTSDPPSLDYRPCDYEVILKNLKTADGFRFWVAHLMGKIWGQASIGDFLLALHDLKIISATEAGGAPPEDSEELNSTSTLTALRRIRTFVLQNGEENHKQAFREAVRAAKRDATYRGEIVEAADWWRRVPVDGYIANQLPYGKKTSKRKKKKEKRRNERILHRMPER